MAVAAPRFIRSSPYRPVLAHPVLRRVLPGFAVSFLGDGMAVVAVSWLAIQLAPAAARGTWVAVAVAAYTLPGAAGTVLFGRFLRGRAGAQLAGWDALLRASALGAIPVFHLLGMLDISLYVALLAVSSLLHSWGTAGRYTVLAEVLPREHHLAGNAVVSTLGAFGSIAGPLLASVLVGVGGAVLVIAVDAGTFAVLAVTYRFGIPPRAGPGRVAAPGGGSRAAGFAVVRRDRTLLGLLTLSFGYFFLFGPVYVALPLRVAGDLGGSAGLLAAHYTAFGVGAVVGALLSGYLGRWRLWPTTIGIVIVFGAAMLPLGLPVPTGVALVSFGLAGLLWPPYASTSTTLFQRSATVAELPQVLAAKQAVQILSVPLGTALGGPLVSTIGASGTLLFSAVATLTLGLAAGAVALCSGRASTSG